MRGVRAPARRLRVRLARTVPAGRVMATRCEPVSDTLEIHYWTGPEVSAPCECGEATRPTPEQREAVRRTNFAEWFARQPGARREKPITR